jgi:cell division protein FtsB
MEVDLHYLAQVVLGLHTQIGQMSQVIGQAQARIAELEAANNLLNAKVKDLKAEAKKLAKPLTPTPKR